GVDRGVARCGAADLAESNGARPALLEPALEDPGRGALEADGSIFVERRAADLRAGTFRPPIPGIGPQPAPGAGAGSGGAGGEDPLVDANRRGPVGDRDRAAVPEQPGAVRGAGVLLYRRLHVGRRRRRVPWFSGLRGR